ncbi:MAG TPA: TylF/MycF/NovP-related O-methyltransferase [Chitinophagaceae bacterium]|nr:TylF/MycF/NovP-related O-methyltransferase [Chitinophagaceae bacterium]
MTSFIQKIAGKFNYEIRRKTSGFDLPNDFEDLHRSIYSKVRSHTMTSPQRLYALIEAVRYIEKYKIPGDIVECGVWKGGSMMAVAETLVAQNALHRSLFLYDTFEGMTPPGELDKDYEGKSAATLLAANQDKEKNPVWAYSEIETVRQGMKATGYPEQKVRYVRGKVEDTIPATKPEAIALLRLDTDWYESTYHELLHLFPLLSAGGVLILDDYGYWQGARKAVDDYFERHPCRIYLGRIDETGRIAIKQ